MIPYTEFLNHKINSNKIRILSRFMIVIFSIKTIKTNQAAQIDYETIPAWRVQCNIQIIWMPVCRNVNNYIFLLNGWVA